jgi:phosphoenolpyruvate-protein kinase (PTS system EI component)
VTAVSSRWVGTGVAPGAAIAVSWRADRPVPQLSGPLDPGRVTDAFKAVAADLTRVAAQARAAGRPAVADIVGTGALIATDPGLLDAAWRAATGSQPLQGITDAVEGYARMLDGLPDPVLRERAADVRQVGRRVVAVLAGRPAFPPAGDFVLVAEDLGPADLLQLLGSGLVAAVAVRGGANSHAAIVARSVGLPLVVGVSADVLSLPDNTSVLVDADVGTVVVDPAADEMARVEAAVHAVERRRATYAAERGCAHVTADGEPFGLLCNVASDTEVRLGRDAGAHGIGLLRTELPFVHSGHWPTVAEHTHALRPILTEASGWPVTVRLLDFANDKVPPFLRGRDGLAALLTDPGALTAQLEAIRALRENVDVRIMVPMVTSAAEVLAVRKALGDKAIPVGAMVETVAAVEAADELCTVVDFLSIGTNDLTAEVLDLDRTDPRARPELTADPRVLDLVARTVTAARIAGRPVSVCGDAGSHPVTLPLLLGVGVRTFSVACARLDETRYRLRRLDSRDCARAVPR